MPIRTEAFAAIVRTRRADRPAVARSEGDQRDRQRVPSRGAVRQPHRSARGRARRSRRPVFDGLWATIVRMLDEGMAANRIVTLDRDEFEVPTGVTRRARRRTSTTATSACVRFADHDGGARWAALLLLPGRPARLITAHATRRVVIRRASSATAARPLRRPPGSASTGAHSHQRCRDQTKFGDRLGQRIAA